MYVSGGLTKSYWRLDKAAKVKRNGSYIDIHYEDDGRPTWFAISRKELEAFLNSDDETGEVSISFDEPANIETALNEFMQRASVKRGMSR